MSWYGLHRAAALTCCAGVVWAVGASRVLAERTWRQLATTGPGQRTYAAMAYNFLEQELVLYGGYRGVPPVGNLNDTWVWNGSQWIQRFPQSSPLERYGHAMAYPSGARGFSSMAARQTAATMRTHGSGMDPTGRKCFR